MKIIAWLAGIGTLLAGAVYMIVSLNRWEWNRALFFGLIVLIAEVGLATGLVLRRARRGSSTRAPRPEVARDPARDPAAAPDRFAWLKDSAGRSNVFITFLVGGGVILSGIAWVVDRVASKTSTPQRRAAPRAASSGRISYPRGGLLVDDVTVLAQEVPGRRRRADPQAAAPRRGTERGRPGSRSRWPSSGSPIGIVGVFALREATLSTHEPASNRLAVEVVVVRQTKGGETRARPSTRWSRRCCSRAGWR